MLRCIALWVVVVFLFSCRNEFPNAKNKNLQIGHKYDSAQLDNQQDLSENNSGFSGYEGIKDDDQLFVQSNRMIWQKPQKVIKYLGADLENKVVADIGAGPIGYFSFMIAPKAKKVIAVDIDQSSLTFIDSVNHSRPLEIRKQLETRLVEPDDPKLRDGEVDIVLIVSTLIYIEDKISYLTNLKNAISKGGKLIIVDFKKKMLPPGFPPAEEKLALFEVEQLLLNAGYELLVSDDKSLDFQYIIVAKNP